MWFYIILILGVYPRMGTNCKTPTRKVSKRMCRELDILIGGVVEFDNNRESASGTTDEM